MNALADISPSVIRTIHRIFLYTELLAHAIGLTVSAIFLFAFTRIQSIHINLRLIFDSFVIANCITTAWRWTYCMQLLIIDDNGEGNAFDLTSEMRNVCMYAGEFIS